MYGTRDRYSYNNYSYNSSNRQDQYQYNSRYNNYQYDDTNYYRTERNYAPKFERVSLRPTDPIPKLAQDEIGVRFNTTGDDFNKIYKKIENKLLKLYRSVTLKGIGINSYLSLGLACDKVYAIADMTRRKIRGLHQINREFSRSYVAAYQSTDVSDIYKFFRELSITTNM